MNTPPPRSRTIQVRVVTPRRPRSAASRLPSKVIARILRDRLNDRFDVLYDSPTYSHYIEYNTSVLTIARLCSPCFRLAVESNDSHITSVRKEYNRVVRSLGILQSKRAKYKKNAARYATQISDLTNEIDNETERRGILLEAALWLEKAQEGLVRARERLERSEEGDEDVPDVIEWRNWDCA